MQPYHNIENEPIINVKSVYQREKLKKTIKNRFFTYGYNEIYTSTFEAYDLYAQMNGTINHREMIKTIDNNGEVLVLRPDITIPLTQKIAETNKKLNNHLRYFYILDVFRQAQEATDSKEYTQAGVEYFGNNRPEADAEIIALAIHLFKDLNIDNFKIELGHAGFFKEITKALNLEQTELKELKRLIKAKNVTELNPFLNKHKIDGQLQSIIKAIPLLYGKANHVIQQANELPLTDKMKQTLENLANIYKMLTNYHVEDDVVIDLGLINHMDYYSDLIFQGFIERVAKPVLMGGRYDTLANQFRAQIPAIGFACDIDLLLEGAPKDLLSSFHKVDLTLLYDKKEQKDCLILANNLRDQNIRVLTYPIENRENIKDKAKFTAYQKEKNWIITNETETVTLQTKEDIVKFIKERT